MSIHKDKKRGTYYFVISNPEGYPKQIKRRGFKTKKEAMQQQTLILHELNQGTYVATSKMKLDELTQKWLRKKKHEVQDVTYKAYVHLIKTHILPFFGQMQIDRIKPLDVEDFYFHLYDEKNLSKRSVQKIHTIIKSVFSYARNMDLISRNPLDRISRPKSDSQEVSVWDKHELQYFLENTKRDPFFIAYQLASVEGMRQGEILGLRWQDIDFEGQRLTIQQTLSNDGKTIKPGAKNKTSKRQVAFTKETLIALKSHKEKQEQIKVKTGDVYNDKLDLVVCTSLGSPINPSNLRRSFNRNIKRLHVKKIRFHDLRHTHATLCLELNIHPKIVASRLGHANTRMTLDTYSHLLPSFQNGAVEKISQGFFD